jgi:hydrogenase maturation protease
MAARRPEGTAPDGRTRGRGRDETRSPRPRAGALREIHLLVCGERLRGDDAAAPLAVDRLPADVRGLATISEVGAISPDMVVALGDDAAVVLADAALGIAAGRIVTRPLEFLADPASLGPAPASSHGLSARHVLALVAEIRGAPVRGTFVGVGGAGFGFGEGLSAAVAASLPEFSAAIEAEIRRLAEVPPGGRATPAAAVPAFPAGRSARGGGRAAGP